MINLNVSQWEEKEKISGFFWMVPIVSIIFLLVASQYNFLLFHTLAELFTVIVAVLMCVVAWQMYPFTRNNFLMYLGCGYFWIGLLDLFHALAYKGMHIFPVDRADLSVQIWIITRYLEAFLLITAPWFLNKALRYRLVFFAYGLIAIATVSLVLSGYMPLMFIEGHGLTEYKVVSEYIIIALLVMAVYFLLRQKTFLDDKIFRLMIASVVLTMGAELAFTFYVEIYGLSNIAGHALKFFSFWLIFTAMIKTTLHEPFAVLSRGANAYDVVPDATILVDKKGYIHQANAAACEFAGKTRQELQGQRSHPYFHPANIDEEDCPLCENMRKGIAVNGREIKDTSRDLWLDYTLSPITGLTEVDGAVEIVRDLTEKKRIETKFDEVNEMKNSIVENLPAMLFVKDAKTHRYVEWNKAAEELTGLLREEMLGKNDYDFFTRDEAEFYTKIDKKVFAEKKLVVIPEETIHTRYNGVRFLHTRKIPIFNHQGEASYLLGISEDITEKRETEEMLRRSQKMEAVGQLSGGIAHDFNNQLGIVTGYLEFLKEYVKNNEKQRGWVENASKAANRCVELTKQLLLFSRAKPTGKENIDINKCINELEDIIQKSVTPEVSINYQLDPEIWQISIDQNELEDAIVNLIMNARDAMPDGGEIIIRTSNTYLDDEYVAVNHGMTAGEYSMIEISDNGFGMSEDVLEHIFEPFFTTKAVGKGTGLGMSMVYAFAQRYQGSIEIDSSPGVGSSVKIYLPRVEEVDKESDADINNNRIVSLPQGNESILIVDDEIDLLNLAEEYLRRLGYQTFKASNARDALSCLQKEKIDLLFSDIVMPGGMNGYELADKVRSDYPSVKVLLSSGYTGKSTGTIYKAVYKELIVPKPYTRQDLACRVRDVLDKDS